MRSDFPTVAPGELVPLELSLGHKDAIRSAVKSIQQDLAALPPMLDSHGMTKNFARNVLAVTERKLVDIANLLDVGIELAAHVEQRSAEIRRANLRNRELEDMLGQAQPVGAIVLSLSTLSKRLKRWWQYEGFGHISEIAYGDYGARVTFSCSFIGCKPALSSPKDSPPSQHEALWMASLEARGFVLQDDDGEMGVADCDKSRETLRAFFAQRLGDAQVSKFISRETRAQVSQLWQVEVYIHDLALIRDLPLPPADLAGPSSAGPPTT